MVTLWNALRLQSGKPTLGHVAPAVYAAFQKDPTYFQDVTDGNNDCTEYCCSQQASALACALVRAHTRTQQGFPASPGWDAATGVGTPNWGKLQSYFSSL